MILYVKNPKDSTQKLLELTQQFSKVARYKINAQKSVAFLHTNNETEEREIKELTLFIIAPKKHKIPSRSASSEKSLHATPLSGTLSHRLVSTS